MRPKVCIPTLTREAGFSLIELLVTLFLASMMLTLMTGFFQANVVTRQKMSLQTEVQQGLRALFEMVTQELRQAGACLPQQGQFIALDGSDGGDQDSLTLRIGKTDPDTLVCAKAGTTADAASGETVLTVAPGDGDLFAEAKLVYVTPNGANGAFYPVASTTSTSITLDEGLAGAHPAGTGIYAVDERVYTVETGSSGRPVLTVSIDGGSSVPLVDGVEEFNVQYRKDPCPPCDEVDEPADDTEWRQVREVVITATVRSHKEDRDGELTREGGYVHVKPRNLL